jgi:hypothetical protein
MENYISLAAERDAEEQSAKLTLSFVAGPFAGEGHAYFDMRRIDAFSRGLLEFPIDRSVAIEGGFLEVGEASLRQVHLGIRVSPAERGLLWLDVKVAQPWDEAAMQNVRSVAGHAFLVDYETLAKLQRGMTRICNGEKSNLRVDFPVNL